MHDGVVLEGCTLWVWGWHSPIAGEGAAGGEEGDLCRDPTDADIDCKVFDHLLDLGAKGKTGVHEKHAAFYRIDDVQHCLVGYQGLLVEAR